MTLMNTFFGMFTNFIYEHMLIYTNLTSYITKGQNRDKKVSKRVKKKVKIENAHRNTFFMSYTIPINYI